MRLVLFALLLSLCSPVIVQDTEVKGVVTDAKGQPISNVDAVGLQHFAAGGYIKVEAKTNEQGRYELSRVGKVVFFRKAKYRPVTKVRALAEGTTNAALETEDSGWTLRSSTPSEQSEKRRYGNNLLFMVPTGVMVKKGKPDDDTWSVFVIFPGNHTERMMIWSGSMMAWDLPAAPEAWYLDGSRTEERTEASAGALDIRGEMPGGKRWRSLEWRFDVAEYHDVSEAAAGFFDKIISSGCRRTFGAN